MINIYYILIIVVDLCLVFVYYLLYHLMNNNRYKYLFNEKPSLSSDIKINLITTCDYWLISLIYSIVYDSSDEDRKKEFRDDIYERVLDISLSINRYSPSINRYLKYIFDIHKKIEKS